VSFAATTLCVASQRVFIVVSVYFVIDSVRKLLDTPSYLLLYFDKYSHRKSFHIKFLDLNDIYILYHVDTSVA
jgi:hypothetical protein